MSTTVNYKNNLLTTVDNSVKILRTAGKYLESDIVLADKTATNEGQESQGNKNDPIRFFDYDGTLVASYTEVPESLPEAPTHKGLIAQGWNWTLEDIATQFESSGTCNIGQMYITDDGKTRIYVTVSDITKSFWFGLCPNGTLSIDWGDGSENSSMTGTSYTIIKTVYHEYATVGDYIISISIESGDFAFYNIKGDYTMLLGKSESVGTYSNHPYGGCVTAIELGESVKIYQYAFSRLFNMKSITISNTVTDIGASAFYGCYSLKSITIPDIVTKINNYVFQSCYALESVIVPNGVTNIGSGTFGGCYALDSIIVPNTVINIGSGAFDDCYALKSITIPNGVTNITNSAFNSCYALKSITVSNSVTNIGTFTFQNCYALESITIPDGITKINTYTFQNCYALKSITIPNGVTNIDGGAFDSCYNMDEYHFLSTTPPTLANKNVFQNIQSNCKIYVPYSANHSILQAYKTATNWSTYADYMVEEGE